ncbi:hypothetical protein J3Q64DRAFT_1718979 [Phycomyces blakesleeanus]|uniref:N-acetyltransferase domain-containing protein n=1 Tax=Phycomyces blakesleeanus TaxID=4837 RepID=A0ABR3BCE6_PHYBL
MVATRAVMLNKPCPSKFKQSDVIHDKKYRMFTILLNEAGLLAALCYLPTQYPTVVEFYHVEIPVAYRHQAIGDLLVGTALGWAVDTGYQVIPTCEFVRLHLENKYIRTHKTLPACIKTVSQSANQQLINPASDQARLK